MGTVKYFKEMLFFSDMKSMAHNILTSVKTIIPLDRKIEIIIQQCYFLVQ